MQNMIICRVIVWTQAFCAKWAPFCRAMVMTSYVVSPEFRDLVDEAVTDKGRCADDASNKSSMTSITWRVPVAWLCGMIVGALFYCVAGTLVIGYGQVDTGGSISTYWARSQTDKRPIRGICASACTMRLKHASCVEREATLGFHAGTHPIGTNMMLGMYAPALRAYVSAHCLSGNLCWITGAQLIDVFRYQAC
ncbi:hypothetical protein [uncultured Rhodoblastus sp.]|uniref:hypothetical protein n=1 Tax=uncultured Rhodoblastus sp. TaxID=543037 RepID=UPI0025FB5E61|nr:hypothetical protein [uncultured Rhodoblastus sp.]